MVQHSCRTQRLTFLLESTAQGATIQAARVECEYILRPRRLFDRMIGAVCWCRFSTKALPDDVDGTPDWKAPTCSNADPLSWTLEATFGSTIHSCSPKARTWLRDHSTDYLQRAHSWYLDIIRLASDRSTAIYLLKKNDKCGKGKHAW